MKRALRDAQDRASKVARTGGSPWSWKANEMVLIKCRFCEQNAIINRCVT